MECALSTLELIEEAYLKNASSREICEWLRLNGDKDYNECADKYFRLRKVYEPIWMKSGKKDIILSICRYGKCSKTLYELYTQTLPYSYKKALLENFSFSKNIGFHDEPWDYSPSLSKKEIVELYDLYCANTDCRLFFHIFLNSAISPDFIRQIFSKDMPYNIVSDKDLLQILFLLINVEKNYFAKKEKDWWDETELRYAANAIINFIPNIFDLFEADNKKIGLIHAEVIKKFLDSTKYLNTNGFTDIKKLSLFHIAEASTDASDKVSTDIGLVKKLRDVQEQSELASLLRIIQFELGSRGICSTYAKDKLNEFSLSGTQNIRELYYKHASMYEIYGFRGSNQYKEFITNTNSEFFNVIAHQLKLKSNKLKKIDEETLYRIADLIEKDNVRFVVAIAQNSNHYFNKEVRALLRKICSAADSRFNMLSYPFGTGTCVELYEKTFDEVKEKYPEYFADESLEIVVSDIQKNLEKSLGDLSIKVLALSKIEHDIKQLLNDVRELRDDIIG